MALVYPEDVPMVVYAFVAGAEFGQTIDQQRDHRPVMVYGGRGRWTCYAVLLELVQLGPDFCSFGDYVDENYDYIGEQRRR